MAQKYAEFRPTQFDCKGLNLGDRQDWVVVPHSRTRDSGPLAESNFAVALRELGGESETCEVHRFAHWGPGWFEIILVSPEREEEADALECADYPVLDDSDFSEREQEAANETWRECFGTAERIEYIRKHRNQFEFRDFADMLGCVRGKYFAGHASELLD